MIAPTSLFSLLGHSSADRDLSFAENETWTQFWQGSALPKLDLFFADDDFDNVGREGDVALPSSLVGAATAPACTPHRRTTTHISRGAAENLIAALDFAAAIGRSLNTAIDIHWHSFAGHVADDFRLRKAQERIAKWCRRRGFPLVWLWVREIGDYGAANTHLLVHVPPALLDAFRVEFEKAFEPEGGVRHERAIKIQNAYYPRGKLDYMLKGLSEVDADLLIKVKPESQGVIVGKRTGTTENIGARARHKAHA